MKTLTSIATVILFYIIVYFFISGINTPAIEGDSVAYHIPIAQSILSGKFINARNFIGENPMRYLPGSSEAILSGFMFLGIPWNIYNIAGLICLLFAAKFAAKEFGITGYYGTIFAITICTLHGITRWLNAQTIDLWLLSYFLFTLGFLQNPKGNTKYFALLGLSSGMLIGSKFTGVPFYVFLMIFYGKRLIGITNIKRFLAYLLPFSVFGLFWYIRNFVGFGNPVYPQPLLFFKGDDFGILDTAVWKMLIYLPNGILRNINALISEYGIWSLSILLIPATFLLILWGRFWKDGVVQKLVTIGILCYFTYLFLPSGPNDDLLVSSLRYAFPAFATFILSIFMIAKERGWEEGLSVIAVLNMLMLPELSYHPKLLFLIVPFGVFIYYKYKSQNNL